MTHWFRMRRNHGKRWRGEDSSDPWVYMRIEGRPRREAKRAAQASLRIVLGYDTAPEVGAAVQPWAGSVDFECVELPVPVLLRAMEHPKVGTVYMRWFK